MKLDMTTNVWAIIILIDCVGSISQSMAEIMKKNNQFIVDRKRIQG